MLKAGQTRDANKCKPVIKVYIIYHIKVEHESPEVLDDFAAQCSSLSGKEEKLVIFRASCDLQFQSGISSL